MKLYTAAQMRSADSHAINVLGTPSITLMERASRYVSDAALELMSRRGSDRAAVFCGTGNNGGDGFGAAVNLAGIGMHVRVFLVGDDSRFTPDTAEMVKRLAALGVQFEKFVPDDFDAGYLDTCGVIIDAIYGFGLHLPFGGDALEAAKFINAASVPVLAADMPSGVEADTGLASPDAVRADVTVTFSAGKIGQYVLPGALCCGEVKICDIGAPVPENIVSGVKAFTVDNNFAILPPRRVDAHKGSFGKILIVGGSVGYTGAPSLAAHAAVRTGAGLVFLGVPDTIYIIEAVKNDEAMPFPLPADEKGTLAENAATIILDKLKNCDACLIGPGLGRSKGVSEIVKTVIKECRVPLVIDADGINALEGNIDILDMASCPVILTPHDGEFKRLGGDVEKAGRLAAATEFAANHHCTLVLKGYHTISAFPDGTACVNTTGGPGLAKGGSGDVLAGMLVSLLGQGLSAEKAAAAAVYLHGKAGDICAERFGEYSMTPSDVIGVIHEAMR